MSECPLRHRKTISCDGEFIPSEVLCLRHAMLFDIWIAEYDGHRVYAFNPGDCPCETPTSGRANPPRLKGWKRAQFHKWLDGLTEERAERLLAR